MERTLIRAIAMAAAFLVSFGVDAADVRFSGVLPDGSLLTRNVVSLRESRYVNMIPQRTDFSCGAAALATLLRYAYRMDVDENVVMQGMLAVADPALVRARGFSLLDIKRYVESLGMRGRGYRVDLQRLQSLRIPTIVLPDTQGYKHFVVLKRVAGDRVDVADPALGNKSYALADFQRMWPSKAVFAVIGSGFDRDTVLFDRSGPPSARALFALQGPISDGELLDFGFTHADLF